MEYCYKKLTEDELRRLEPETDVWVQDHPEGSWDGPFRFRCYDSFSSFPIRTAACGWKYAAIREPVEQIITMDREWQTQDKRKFHVYCTDAPGPYPVHGRAEGEHHPSSRTINGRIGLCDNKHDLIPAPDWREQIPWDRLQPWVNVVTWDGAYGWRAHYGAPYRSDATWLPVSRVSALEAVSMPPPPDDWREAIASRPKSEG